MVTVEVCETESGDGRDGHAGVDELALGALSWVEQQSFVVPPEQVAVLVPTTGRCL